MNGSELIAQERQRQITQEGWSAEHDDKHPQAVLAVAAASYLLDYAAHFSGEIESWREVYQERLRGIFPFDDKWWKPTHSNPIKQLVKAGAFIAAEIDKLQREELKKKKEWEATAENPRSNNRNLD